MEPSEYTRHKNDDDELLTLAPFAKEFPQSQKPYSLMNEYGRLSLMWLVATSAIT